jgi:flagellar FliJ protein
LAQFVFKLDGVLRHRERVEEDRQRELAIVQAELSRLQAMVRGIEEEMQKSTADVRDNHLVGRLNMAYLAAHRRYMLGMQRKGMDLLETVNAQQARVNEARAALAEASKQKKILEKLRERHKERWVADVARAEASAADELATQMSFGLLAESAVEEAQ